MARILDSELLFGEYITVRRRVKIDSPFDMCAEIDYYALVSMQLTDL